MIHSKTKAECQANIEHAINQAKINPTALTQNNASLLSLIEDVNTVTQMAKIAHTQKANKTASDYIENKNEIEIQGIILSCILPKAYEDPYYLAMNPDMTLEILKRGRHMITLIDESMSSRCACSITNTVIFFRKQYAKIKQKTTM